MPIRSYLESPAAKAVIDGKPFAAVSISRRYLRCNIDGSRKLGERSGGTWVDKTHFVAAGGQVKSMTSWLGFMFLGEPRRHVLGIQLPKPNLNARLRGAGAGLRRPTGGQRASPERGRLGEG